MRLAGFLPPVSTRMAAPLSQRLIFLRANELLSWNTAKTAHFAANKDAFAHLWPDFYLHCYYEQCNYTLLHFGAINSNEIIHGKYPLSFLMGRLFISVFSFIFAKNILLILPFFFDLAIFFNFTIFFFNFSFFFNFAIFSSISRCFFINFAIFLQFCQFFSSNPWLFSFISFIFFL